MATHQEMHDLIAKARRVTDGDGDWAECYADDVSQLLAEIARLRYPPLSVVPDAAAQSVNEGQGG